MEVTRGHYLFNTYYSIIQRCCNPNDKQFVDYGGRGIELYAPWRENSNLFYTYILEELGERPEGYQLDRTDNDKGYEPGNLRWATRKQQIANRRPTRYFTKKNHKIGKSGFKWVVAKKKKWRGQFSHKNQNYWTRAFPTPEEAYNEVLQMRAEMGLPLE